MSTFLSILPIIIALVLYFTGIPIAYALFAAALTYFGFIDTTTVPYLLMQKFVTATQSFPFLAIPFFIMCGSIMNYGGISARLMVPSTKGSRLPPSISGKISVSRPVLRPSPLATPTMTPRSSPRSVKTRRAIST